MKKRWSMICLVLAVAGCVTAPSAVTPLMSTASPAERVSLGMTYAMVAGLMNAKVVVAYEVDPITGASKSVEAQNLYSSEIVKINAVTYRVDRYILHPPQAGLRVVEAELFPVVYRDGLVVARGREGSAALLSSGKPAEGAVAGSGSVK